MSYANLNLTGCELNPLLLLVLKQGSEAVVAFLRGEKGSLIPVDTVDTNEAPHQFRKRFFAQGAAVASNR